MFFSATMPATIAELAARYLTDPVEVEVTPAATTVERVDQVASFVSTAEKQALLAVALTEEDVQRALVFTRTKHGADRVVKKLAEAGIDAAAIHGNKSQPQRERALAAFRAGRCKVLVATDIAARGVDVPGVSHVINFEMPNVPEQYVHRIGRTARAGASGLAIPFVADDERPLLRDIEKLTRQKLTIVPLPEGFTARPAPAAVPARPAGPRPPAKPARPRRRSGGSRSGASAARA
jgi:ATP-dependent RNA helicase RhlE